MTSECKKGGWGFINGYRLDRQLEPNGKRVGEVWSATHPDHPGKSYAVKVERQRDGQPTRLKHEYAMYQEVHRRGRLDGCLQPLFYQEKEGVTYMGLPLFPNDLGSIKGRFTWDVIAKIGYQLICILEKLHLHGIYHCDIRPRNILIDGDLSNFKKCYLADFELAQRSGGENKKSENVNRTMTYTSINVQDGGRYSSRDDLVSLAFCLAFLSKKSLPWDKNALIKLGIRRTIDMTMRAKQDINDLVRNRKAEFQFTGPPFMVVYLNYVFKLREHHKPDYYNLKGLFRPPKKLRALH